ncbi:MAG: hypothetical protein GWO81_02735 [Verrucomicrobia bacterium]|nr:hypothetical protein [Verrucomicrobiota bacterium]
MKSLLLPLVLGFAASLQAQTVTQVWNFNEDGEGLASLNSESGTNTTFFGSDAVASDGGLTINRASGNSGDISIGGSFNQANTSTLTLSVVLTSMDVAVGGTTDFFKINLRNDASNTKYASLSMTEHTAGLRIVTDAGVAGVAVASNTTGPITYGLTLDFLSDTYTTWIGTPTSNNSTWANRFGAAYTGTWDIGTETIDGLQWSVSDFSNANTIILDQVQISTVAVVPEPQTYAVIAGVLAIGAVVLRRRLV